MKLKTKLSTLLLGITSIFALTAAIVTNPNSGNAIEAKADDVTQTYLYGDLSNWELTNYTDSDSYYLVPATGTESIATLTGIFNGISNISSVVVTLNVATYGNGTNPGAPTFSFYTSSNCSTSLVATQGGTLPTSKTYTNVIYTISSTSLSLLENDLAIKITKPGKQIRLKSIKVEYSYSLSSLPTLTGISATSTQSEVTQYSKLDTSAIEVTGHYDDNSKKVLSSGWTVECDTSVVAKGVTATVTYEGFTATFTVDVVELGQGIIPDGKYFISTSPNEETGKMLSASSIASTSIPVADSFSTSDNSKAWTFTHIRHDSKENVYTIKRDSMSLYSTDTNKGIRIGAKSDDECNWQISLNANGETYTISSLHTPSVRKLACYNNQDWRGYATNDGVQALYLIPVTVLSGAETYAKEFLDTITCSGQGSITAAEGAWSTMGTKFNALSDVDKETLASATGNDLGTVIERCIYRYEAIIMKYGTSVYNDFMSRGIVSPAHGMIKPNIVEDAPITEIIVIASISAVTLIGLFAISKKRKEN